MSRRRTGTGRDGPSESLSGYREEGSLEGPTPASGPTTPPLLVGFLPWIESPVRGGTWVPKAPVSGSRASVKGKVSSPLISGSVRGSVCRMVTTLGVSSSP